MEVKLHDIGEGMQEAEIIQIFVQNGDFVAVDQPLLEVQTDKLTAEISAPAAGTVAHIAVNEGDRVQVGDVLIQIKPPEEKEEALRGKGNTNTAQEKIGPNNVEKVPEKKEQHFKIPRTKRVLATPYTRKIARENGVDIERLHGSGPGGRVTDEDVLAAVKTSSTQQSAEQEEKTTHSAPQTMPFRARRKQIARKMVQSAFTIPHVTHFDEVDMGALLKTNQRLRKEGVHLSLAAFFTKAVQLALKRHPIFNATLDVQQELIHFHPHCNIGMAVDTEEGLIVPVIHEVERLSITSIHEKLRKLVEKARENQLTAHDLHGGTFTISNVGPLGSTGATPIIREPEVGILAFHKTKKRAVVTDDDQIVARSMMNISLSFDHRIVDGASAVAFTNTVISYLEKPEKMLVELV